MATHAKAPRNLNRPWTKQQESDLLDMYGVYPFSYLSRYFGKRTYAIQCKYASLTGNWSALQAGGYVRTSDIATAMDVSDTTVRRWIRNHELPIMKLHQTRNDTKRRMYYISVEEFWKWARKNKSLFSFANIKRNALLPEPDWLEDEVRKCNDPAKVKKTWSKEEEEKAYKWFMSGIHYKEIAARLGRTANGTHHKLMRIIDKKRKEVR